MEAVGLALLKLEIGLRVTESEDSFFHISVCGDYEPARCDEVSFPFELDRNRQRYKAAQVQFPGSSVANDYFDCRVSRDRL
jgi:hypothetical protein